MDNYYLIPGKINFRLYSKDGEINCGIEKYKTSEQPIRWVQWQASRLFPTKNIIFIHNTYIAERLYI